MHQGKPKDRAHTSNFNILQYTCQYKKAFWQQKCSKTPFILENRLFIRKRLYSENSAQRISERLNYRYDYKHYADESEGNHRIQAPSYVIRYVKRDVGKQLYHGR